MKAEFYICDGCFNVSKRNSPCCHSFCDGESIHVIMKELYTKAIEALNFAMILNTKCESEVDYRQTVDMIRNHTRDTLLQLGALDEEE